MSNEFWDQYRFTDPLDISKEKGFVCSLLFSSDVFNCKNEPVRIG
jgi:hypothetical protein